MTSPSTADDGRELASPADAAAASALVRAGEELRQVPAGLAATHLEAITALAATHAHAPTRSARSTWHGRVRRLVGLTVFKVALGAGVAAAATTGGLAATGHLPDPVQQAVSDGARWVGVDLPSPRSSPTAPPDDEASAEDVTTPRPDGSAPAPAEHEPRSPVASTSEPTEADAADDPEPSPSPGSPTPGAPPVRPGPDASPRPDTSPSPADPPSRRPSRPSAPPAEPTPGARSPEVAVGGRVPTSAR